MNHFIHLLIKQEKSELEKLLAQMFGYHLIQLGDFLGGYLPLSSPIQHKTIITASKHKHHDPAAKILANYESLPLLTDSIDVALLPHTLENCQDFKLVLQEIWRVLIPNGQAIILGFNPVNFWNLIGVNNPIKKIAFLKYQNIISNQKLKKTLLKIGFEVCTSKTFFYRPALQNIHMLDYLKPLDKLGHFIWPSGGVVYLYHIRKRVVALTPIKPRWQTKRVPARVLAEPTRRNDLHG
jgi:SAM-dependent methyltransferase